MANKLSHIRRDQNLSQEDLARISGVSRVSISNIETGKTNPTVVLATRLARALHVSIEDFSFEHSVNRNVQEATK